MNATSPKVVVVGAGPAGVRCAEALLAAGIRPVLIEEGTRDGGQIYRRQPASFSRAYADLYGTEAARAEALHRAFDALRPQIDYRPATLAWNVYEGRLHLVAGAAASSLPFDALIVCAGAADRIMPVKGWHFAGAYTLGGAQISLKSQACAIGRNVVFLGTGPLLYLIASQYVKAGAKVAAVLDTSPWHLRLAALPALLARPATLINGIRMTLALMRAGVRVRHGIEPVEIHGTPEAGVQAVSFRDSGGATHRLDCDAVAFGYHVRAETQLADLARCAFRFDENTRQWLPETDADGRTSVSGVYLAGDGAGVRGADAAEAAGRLAAHAVLADMGRAVDAREVANLRAVLATMRRFSVALQQAFPWPAAQAARLPDEAILCRCEAISVGEIRRAVAEKGATEANRAKAFTRVGMGRCQGRYCGQAAAEVIAASAGVPLEQVGRLRGQAPVKPISMGTKLTEAGDSQRALEGQFPSAER
jgi:NADPH-dependent 2,4-dienoyl-CoA reductase/sulfur reductase-like enzyme